MVKVPQRSVSLTGQVSQHRTDKKRGLAIELFQGTHYQPTYHEEQSS